MSNIVIIGSGPAGVSAALYAARAGVQTTVLTKGPGALDRAELIQNYYGFAEPITGAELERRGIEGAKAVGVEFVTTEAVGLTYTDKLTVETLAGDFPADAVIPACRCSHPQQRRGAGPAAVGSRRDPSPRCSSPCRCCPGSAGPCMGHREPAPRPGCVRGGFRQPLGGYSELGKNKRIKEGRLSFVQPLSHGLTP